MDTVPKIPTPMLPVELLDQIITETWASPMSVEDRTTLLQTLPLVNSTVFSLFTYISWAHTHIVSSGYADRYLRILRGESPLYKSTQLVNNSANSRCRSLTFHLVDKKNDPSLVTATNYASSLSTTLYLISSLNYLPNMRRISIEYSDCIPGDIFEEYHLIPFPDQVTHLDMRYSFSQSIPKFLERALREQEHPCTGWTLLSVKELTVVGAGSGFIKTLAGACPGLEVLETDAFRDFDAVVPHLPKGMHTLSILR